MIALENVPSGVLQARLARYAEAANCRAALLLVGAGDELRPTASWLASDERAIQARLLLDSLVPADRRGGLRLPRSAFSLNAVLEGQVYDDPAPLLRAAGLDPSLASVPAAAAGVDCFAAVPLGPRASEGVLLLALADRPSLSELRRTARALLEDHVETQPAVLQEIGEPLSLDLMRLYRLESYGNCTVVGAWQSGGSLLPEQGESLSAGETPLQAVIDSEDSALVETAKRGDWLSTLAAAQGIQTALFKPLMREGRITGILELGTRRRELDLGAIEERLPRYIADLLALLDGHSSAGLDPFSLVRSFAAQPSFPELETADRLCVEVLRPDKKSVEVVIGGPLEHSSEVAPLAGSATGDVMSGQPLAVSTESVNGWFNQALLAQGFRSVLRVPLRYDHELLGVLSLASRRADAFATAPPGVVAFAEQLSVLVAAERSRLQGHLDARRGEFLASIATAQSQAETGHGFAAAASVIAASVNADAVWLQTPETDSGWPDPVPILPHAPIGQARCRADVSQRSDDDLDRELAGQGFRSVLVVPEGQHNLICAARAPYAFSAETIALVTPAVRLVAAAHSRAVLAAGRSQVSALESAAVLIEPASGEIIDINPSAGKLLQAVRGDSLWSIAATNSALSARSRLTSATGAESFDVVIDRGGEQRTLEVYAAGAPRGLWLLTLRDATEEKLSKRWVAALQRAALAAQSAAGIGELQESIVQVLREHDLQATLDAVDGPPRATDQVTVARGWPRLELDDRVLVIEHEATSDIGEALDAFRRDVTSALERLRAEARLRETNEQLADAVAARTAELEGLYAYSRDLGEAERVEEALAIAVTHIASALGSPAAAVICLSGRHFGAGSPAGQARAETMLQELDPREHLACRGLVRGPGNVERLDVAKALVSTSRGRGLVIVELEDKPDNEQLKLLLAHASQLGATLDRLRLREEAEGSRLRSIADVVGEGIALVDAEGTVEPENAAAEELLADLRNPNGEYARQLTDLIAAARDLGEPVEREISASGRTFLGAARAIPASAGQIALTLRDVTEQRLTQERLSQSERLAALGQLVSGVAHELNNPLTGILGFAQLLQDKPLDDDARRSVETIQSEAERAGKIIQDLLSFARRREPVREAVDVNELLSRVLNIRAYDLQSDGVNVELDLAGDLPAVDGDGDQLQQVFFNVLTNAVQAVRQTASPKRIAVETRRHGDNIRVRFSDSGPGIPAEALSRVFEPFFTTKEAGEGTGLGLSISYGIVKEHGGSITVGNAPSGGAIVEIVLPVRTSSAGAGSDERLPATESTPVRVLVADDEESIRAVLSRMLMDEGHQVIAVEDGAQALAVLSRENFDLVITDLKMPEINGQELYAEIKASDAAMARRVIFITGDTLNPETRAFIDSVDNPTLEKPFRLERLRELISQVLA